MIRSYLTSEGPVPGLADPTPAATGTPGTVQGGYGSRGNLELLIPAPDGGVTVCWFNSDRPEGPVVEPSIPAATWSAGLHVPAGPCAAAAVVQTTAGPDFVEVVTSGPEGLSRWTWSPGPGFEPTGRWPGAAGLPYVAETPAGLVLGQATGRTVTRHRGARTEELLLDEPARAVACDPDGTVLVVAGTQVVQWTLDGACTAVHVALAEDDVVALTTGPDLLLAAGSGWMRAMALEKAAGATRTVAWDQPVDALACTWSRMDDDVRLEIVTRTGTALRHHRWAVSQGA